MNMLAQPLRLTAEEFEKLADHKGIELIDGIVKGNNAGTESGAVGARVATHLSIAVMPDDLGEVVINDGMYRCFPNKPNRVRKPDVSFLLRSRLPNGEVPVGISALRPDIAVEVVSPNDEYEQVDEKVADYFAAGVPLVWVFSPATRTVLAYRADGSARRLTTADDLTAEPIIPGFRVRVEKLFPPRATPAVPAEPEPEPAAGS